jgi:hypothetical protein
MTPDNVPIFLFDDNRIQYDEKIISIRPPINGISCICYWKSVYGEFLIIGQMSGFLSFVDL